MSGSVHRLWIKICGMRTAEAIEAAASAGADAVGFVFFEGSPRNVSARQARSLREVVPSSLERVAVFLHPSQALVDAAVDALEPHWLQADAADFERLRLPQSLRVLPVLRGEGGLPALLPRRLLFEGAHSGRGARADWAAARRLAASAELILGGGLDATNVDEAVRSVQPFGVDVSSGVEKARGEKDPARIRDFVAAAREAMRASSREKDS